MVDKNFCWKLQVEILTPVHIGTGRELFFERDYIMDGHGQILVVDQNALFEELATSEGELSEYISSKDIPLSKLVEGVSGQEKGYKLGMLGNRPISKRITEKDQEGRETAIREQIKDGFSQPYLPGSSIKGAIRTALLAKMVNDQGLEAIKNYLPKPCDHKLPSKGNADNRLMRALFSGNAREESYHDFLRALHVSDVIFAENGLAIADIHYLNLVGGAAQTTWKIQGGKVGRKPIDDWKDEKATLTFNEVLKPTSISISDFTLQIDHFLLKEQNRQLGWQNIPDFSDFDKLKTILNEHARNRLESEITFFREYKLEQVRKQCEQLRNKVIRDDKSCYLQIGWGNGWRGMTGEWMNKQTEEEMRKCFGLGKVSKKACNPEEEGNKNKRNFYELNYPIFPKTRRLVVANHQPCIPLGWIRLFPQETHLALQFSREETCRVEETQLSPEEKALHDIQQAFEQAKNSKEKQGGPLSNLLDKFLKEAHSWEPTRREQLAALSETIYTALKWWGNSEKKKQKQARLNQLKEK